MNHLKRYYDSYLRDKVNEKYIVNKYNSTVLGENFLNGYYFLLLGDADNNREGRYDVYLIVENCKNSKIFKVYDNTTKKTNEYQRFEKGILSENLDKKAFNSLIVNGLFKNLNSGKSKLNNIASVHRLNACLYSNILNLEIHHNNKYKADNYINNLTPIKKEVHDKLDILQGEKYYQKTKEFNDIFKKKIFSPEKNTLLNNNELVLEILLMFFQNLTIDEVARKFKNKLSLGSIYKIKNHYYYLDEFIKYLYRTIILHKEELNENYNYRWEKILEFNVYIYPNYIDIDEFEDMVKHYLLKLPKKHFI